MTPESGYSDGSLIYSVVLALNIVQGFHESSVKDDIKILMLHVIL